MSENKFLPICKKDMEERGWEQLDFVYISGDAYVDHPTFGVAIRLSDMRSLRDFWKRMDLKSVSLRSRTGKIRTALRSLENRDWDSLFLREIWIRW